MRCYVCNGKCELTKQEHLNAISNTTRNTYKCGRCGWSIKKMEQIK